MTPKYCQNCGTKSENKTAHFCASCGTPLNGVTSVSTVQTRRPPSRLSRATESDDPDATDIEYVPEINKLEVQIDGDGSSEFPGFSSASSFSINPDGTSSVRKFKPRRL